MGGLGGLAQGGVGGGYVVRKACTLGGHSCWLGDTNPTTTVASRLTTTTDLHHCRDFLGGWVSGQEVWLQRRLTVQEQGGGLGGLLGGGAERGRGEDGHRGSAGRNTRLDGTPDGRLGGVAGARELG